MSKNITFAARGTHTNSAPNEDIFANPSHYQLWSWHSTHSKSGQVLFNLDFLGKWRETDLPTWEQYLNFHRQIRKVA